MKFKAIDYNLSPYTGLTRESWIEAGAYLLSGIFQDVESVQNPIVVKRTETEITYPHKTADEEVIKLEKMAERFEGLARSFFIAAPLIHNDCNTEINGLNIRDYYKIHILRSCSARDELYVGDFDYLLKNNNTSDPFPKFQQTVECAALAIGLWVSKEAIWNLYTKEEQDIIANFIKSFAYGNTYNDNWRMFNMLCLAFLDYCGYEIDERVMLHHTHTVLNWYCGDGWYRDAHAFDYYSIWAFNLYGPIWNNMYGYRKAPELAKEFEKNSNKLMETYGDLFDKDGFTIMWGRSGIYRNGSTAGFVGNAFLKNAKADFGLARRIMSGALKQFLDRDDFLENNVPSLGFYGQFHYLLQPYSCAASPLWCAKPFLALYFPETHPIWSEVEKGGSWEDIGENVRETVLNGPGLCYTNHGANGETVLRTGDVVWDSEEISYLWSYSKLSYNSKYPWEATPVFNKEVESQQYVIEEFGNIIYGNVTQWRGKENDVLYRKQYFDFHTKEQMVRMHKMELADFPVKNGIIRVDRLDTHRAPLSITLGSYGFPDNGTEIIKMTCDGAKAVVLRGKDKTGVEKQLAMTIYDGWDDIDVVHSEGTNPDSEKSIVIYGKAKREKAYDGKQKAVFISQVITKEDAEPFTEEEIFPIENICYSDKYRRNAVSYVFQGGYGI